MCGLTGFWDLKKSTEAGQLSKIASHMASFLEARGPDGEGVWVDKAQGIALAHRRLAIIDLTPTGHQPMVSPSGRYIMTYVGEVYNFSELREGLLQKGVSFKGTSDTEVMLAAIEQYGLEAAVQKFVGMFAFALWDTAEKVLFLVRDRVGVKPLYWGLHKGTFWFGSQLKSFRGHPSFAPSLNREALGLYFRYNYIPAPHTIFEEFHKLKPGHILRVDREGRVEMHPYWQLSEVLKTRPSEKRTLEEVEDELESLLKDSVQKRMISDVPLGCFLSGGVDSSLVAALMQGTSQKPIKTFSIGFTENAYNEAPYAKRIAQYLGTDHQEFYVTPEECQKVIPTIPEWCDEPFADASQIPTYLVSKMASAHVTVALSGDGGDELFGGYNRYKMAEILWKRIEEWPLSMRKGMGQGLQKLSPFVGGILNKTTDYSDVENKLDKFGKVLKAETQEECYRYLVSHWSDPAALIKGMGSLHDTTLDHYFGHSSLTFTERMQWADMMTYLPDDILTKVDRASMAVSLEAREPLLDHRLVEFAWQKVLSRYKIHEGQTKYILRRILFKHIPKSYFDRPKQGFAIPLGAWLRSDLKEWAEDLLSPTLIERQGILKAGPIQTGWKKLQGGGNNEYEMWGVLMFQSWLVSQEF